MWVGCGAAPEPAHIEGEIRYSGSLKGALVVSAYATFPPRGEPLTSVTIATPAFPQRYTLQVPPGDVFVLAMLDTSPDDGFRYHSRVDAGAAWPALLGPAPVRTNPGATAQIDLDLLEPGPGLPSP